MRATGNFFCLVFYFLLFFSCSVEHQKKDDLSWQKEKEVRKIDSLSMVKRPCSCNDSIGTGWQGRPLVTFSNHKPGTHYGASENFAQIPSDDKLLAKYATDSVRLSVKEISFSNYDTIPEKFSIFENVEYVFSSTAQGLDIFPNLKSVHFFLANVKVDSTHKWLRRVEILVLDKSSMNGLLSFKPMHNLKLINLGFGAFSPFPKDIESLSCLTELIFGGYTGRDTLDLNVIDLSGIACLKKAELFSWHNNMKGIPKGLNKLKDVSLSISHPGLTKSEKQIIKTMSKKK